MLQHRKRPSNPVLSSSLQTLNDGLRLVILREQFLNAIDGMCGYSA